MQKNFEPEKFAPPAGDATALAGFRRITANARIDDHTHGGRAKCLQRLIRLDLPVPRTLALSFQAVQAIAEGHPPDTHAMLAALAAPESETDPEAGTDGAGPAAGLVPGLVSVRPSSQDADWGGPGAILNIGMNDERHQKLVAHLGAEAADELYLRFIQSYALHVARLDADLLDEARAGGRLSPAAALRAYEEEADALFPQDPAVQLAEVLRSMARAWAGTSARLLRQARGAPADAGLGLVVQVMALGLGPAESGAGVIQFIDGDSGQPRVVGHYRSQAQGREALLPPKAGMPAPEAEGCALETLCPAAHAQLLSYGALCRRRLREEMQIEFTLQAGRLYVLDAVRVPRSARAGLRVAVALAEDGIIPREEAVMRVPPRALTELVHRQVDPAGRRDLIFSGIGASPGGATGRIAFSSTAAQAFAAQGESCILVRRETTPEDVRGMHVAAGVLTERGGPTSHAAVLARGLGLPCVVGVAELKLSSRDPVLTAPDGRDFHEGDVITLDGSHGEVLAGAAGLLDPALDDSFRTLLAWSDGFRDLGIRANADTPTDAQTARTFGAQGIGLCRTEHMFFEEGRLNVMQEMIFANDADARRAVLERLLPMQRADFTRLFTIMQGLPVCIRLFDPPLHEFLPSDREGIRNLAEGLALPVREVTARIESMSEFNPMLGLRGVRLGIVMPEIYEMQARAIFEATIEAARQGAPLVPEIMIPLISARREVELVKSRIDGVAASVRNHTHEEFSYRLGVMVETPRAALRAGEIALHAEFLSFGTNDLTQMTYGLSRDDAGRFMGAYVRQGVFPEDPFHTLDTEGVGELLTIGAARGRSGRPGITVALCGEHGGNPESIAFCRSAGFDYVSCSPYRVPVARLAAAQLALQANNAPKAPPLTR